MKDINITSDNSFYNFNERLGVFFNDQMVYPDLAENNIRTYTIRIAIHEKTLPVREKISEYLYELVEFQFTGNLCEYRILEDRTSRCGEKYTIGKFEFKSIINSDDKFISLYDNAVNRIERKRVSINTEKKVVSKNVEFLEFTSETSYMWCGPELYNDNEGCHCRVMTRNESVIDNILSISDFASNVNEYDMPRKYMDESLYQAPKEERISRLSKLSDDALISTYTNWLKSQLEYMIDNYKYHIYLSGNDDCSYSKGFNTIHEVELELQYLRDMQPLDFTLDISNRNYKFSN